MATCSCKSAREELPRRAAVGALLRFPPRRLAVLRFRGFPAYCATPSHVTLPVADGLNLPHRQSCCADTAKLTEKKIPLSPKPDICAVHALNQSLAPTVLGSSPRASRRDKLLAIGAIHIFGAVHRFSLLPRSRGSEKNLHVRIR